MSKTPKLSGFWKTRKLIETPIELCAQSQSPRFTITTGGKLWVSPKNNIVAFDNECIANALVAELRLFTPPYSNLSIPFATLLNVVFDYTPTNRQLIIERMQHILSKDSLCYRDNESDLASKQEFYWQKCVSAIGLENEKIPDVTDGFRELDHSESCTKALVNDLQRLDNFELTAVIAIAEQFDSLLIALAAAKGGIDKGDAWEAGRVEEIWQRQRWGELPEHIEADKPAKNAFEAAHQIFEFSK